MKSNLKKSMAANAKARRRTAIERLKKQLTENTKPNKDAILPHGIGDEIVEDIIKHGRTVSYIRKVIPYISLTPKDRERIQKEIAVLETRI